MMPYGYGYGFRFRGASPPWPYIGRGRGGLPRCWYPGAFAAPPYPSYSGAWGAPYYGGQSAPWATPYAPPMTQEQELDFLRDQAKAVKEELEDLEARIKELEAKEQ